LLLLARTGAAAAEPERALSLFVVDLEAPGVTVTPVTLLDGRTRVYRVALADVRVPATHRLGAAGGGLAAVQTLAEAAEREFEPAAGLARLAAGLSAAAQELPGDAAERLADEPGFAGRLAELGVELAGLEALEWRWLAQEVGAISRSRPPVDRDLEIAPTVRGRDLEIAPTVLRLRRTAITQRIGALFGEAFGYYSLPYPDPVTIDNEGPIGHHYALAALQGMLAGRLLPIDGGTSEMYRDRIANHLFRL
jgi:alkylation response protein AidB-like acyl-CoA dehydrogenase